MAKRDEKREPDLEHVDAPEPETADDPVADEPDLEAQIAAQSAEVTRLKRALADAETELQRLINLRPLESAVPHTVHLNRAREITAQLQGARTPGEEALANAAHRHRMALHQMHRRQ